MPAVGVGLLSRVDLRRSTSTDSRLVVDRDGTFWQFSASLSALLGASVTMGFGIMLVLKSERTGKVLVNLGLRPELRRKGREEMVGSAPLPLFLFPSSPTRIEALKTHNILSWPLLGNESLIRHCKQTLHRTFVVPSVSLEDLADDALVHAGEHGLQGGELGI